MPLNQNGHEQDINGNEIEGGQIQIHSSIQHQNLIERTRILLHDIIIRNSFPNYIIHFVKSNQKWRNAFKG